MRDFHLGLVSHSIFGGARCDEREGMEMKDQNM